MDITLHSGEELRQGTSQYKNTSVVINGITGTGVPPLDRDNHERLL